MIMNLQMTLATSVFSLICKYTEQNKAQMQTNYEKPFND